MGIFSEIKFVPLSEPFDNRVKTLAVGFTFVILVLGFLIGIGITLHTICVTRYWWLTLLYLYFCYTDLEVCRKGGKPWKYIRNWPLWKYYASYFPITVHKAGTKDFDARKNYFLSCYPHGMLPLGLVVAMSTTATNWQKLFPRHETRCSTYNAQFYVPFFRELGLALGWIASDAKSIKHVLKKPEGGYMVSLHPGGGEEAFLSQPGKHKIVLKKRRGFVKLALETGASLVPVYTFGETDVCNQSQNKLLRALENGLRKICGVAMLLPLGRGLFQYNFGFIQFQVPLDIVVGDPIEVKKSENPTLEEIEELHQKYTNALVELFEKEKHKYVKNPESVKLEVM